MSDTPAQTPLPPLYGSLAPLTALQHGRLKLRPAGYGFARHMPAVPLAVEEFPQAARHMGVVFATQPPHLPLAILGSGSAHHLFIDAAGGWQPGVYLPAYLRRYPFLLVRLNAGSEEMALCVDAGAEQLSEAEGEALFDEAGKPSAAAQARFEFARALEGSFRRTHEFAKALAEMKLLAPAALHFELDGRPMRVDGFHAVQREALQALSPAQLAELRDKGWLEAIYAHLFSVAALQAVARPAS